MSIFEVSTSWGNGLGQVLVYALIALLILKLMTKIGEDDE